MATHQQRTCIGCRGVFSKQDVVRVTAGPAGAVIDYREKLPGRAAYICPRMECIERALARDVLARALRKKVPVMTPEQFAAQLIGAIRTKISSLISMAGKAGQVAAGASAVEDALSKGRIHMLIFATNLSEGTREKVMTRSGIASIPHMKIFTTEEIGAMLGRELIGIIGIIEKGFATALWRECERLKGLINRHA